jgi:excinuclease ABC subunit C
MTTEQLKNTINRLPAEPGIYKYYNNEEVLIYVGKAKNIKKRVSSYFTKSHQDNKTRSLVSQIFNIEFIVVNTEADALLLENNLIKSNQPKYNILLRDDKTYPFVVVTKDRFPKIYSTRKYIPTLGTYYGPFPSVRAMDTVMTLIKQLYTVRNCDLNLSPLNIQKGKFKKCMEYHLGNCKAPCEGLQTEDDYNSDIEKINIILKGDLRIIRKSLTDNMKKYAETLDYENAEKEKNKIEYLEKFQSNTLILNHKYNNLAIFTINTYKEKIYINYLYISFGRVTQSKTIEAVKKLDESDEEILETAIFKTILDYRLTPDEILSNIPIGEINGSKVSVPLIGDKRKLTDLSLKNIEFYHQNISLKEKKEAPAIRVLETLKSELNLKELPTHIECFDNSNLQGTTPVAAMSCFKNGVPSKKDYRHFNIKTVIGPNDFDSMKEIVHRRYLRLINENLPLPNLIIIDGGKGQLKSAVEALTGLGIYGQIPIISIAKRLEEIYIPGDSIPLHLDKKSEGLRLIQKLRDEVHRFGITFHRLKRDKIKREK